MNRPTLSLILAGAVLLSACATRPENIAARYVSPNTYRAWNCAQLQEERIRLDGEVARVANLQRENANADAALLTVGLIIFWPALIGMAATTDRREELGRLRGEHDAVQTALREQNCAVPPPSPAPPVETAAPPAVSNP
ncbi:hypothetical protein [Roseococcus microcysteis]|uniref:hypothetical protein n=1 Tax=Roseococcus microcysteis TaxID=2771361 RepID=UPI00168B0D37|nr:hypothetical protein [Roseococcus microcysteis]